jgi:hypothetical protein
MKNRILLSRAGLGGLLFMGLALASPSAQAGKPAGGGNAPGYTYINLGALDQVAAEAIAINSGGVVVGRVRDAAYSTHISAFVVVPKDTNHDGLPDVWFEDANHDGLNDLQIALGCPPGFEGVSVENITPMDINDLGQILFYVSVPQPEGLPYLFYPFVLTPRDVDNDGRLEFVSGTPGGPNSLMEPLNLDGILDYVTPLSINNLGQIVGEGYLPGGSPWSVTPPMGFVLSGEDNDGDGVADTWFVDSGSGVNGLVQLLGFATDQSGRLTTVTAVEINDRGEIAGNVPRSDGEYGNACLIRPRVTETGQTWCVDNNGDGLNDLAVKLLPVNTKTWGAARAISPGGKLTGWATLNGGKSDLLLLWQVDATGTKVTTTQLPRVGGENMDKPAAINASDVIVGITFSYGGGVSIRDEGPFVFQNGTTTDLRTLTDQTSLLKGVGMGATDINNAGQIVGWTESSTFGYQAFIAVPVKK